MTVADDSDVRRLHHIKSCHQGNIVQQSLIVEEILSNNQEKKFSELVANKEFAATIVRFLDYVELISDNVSIMNAIGMMKTIIDDLD
jgi:hypothetical protein